MDKTFIPMETAERWQMSNAPVFSMAACRASLEIFAEAGMDALVEKSQVLTAYLEFLPYCHFHSFTQYLEAELRRTIQST